MRIGPSIVVQKVDEAVVILDESSGEEVVIPEQDCAGLIIAVLYFFPHLEQEIRRAGS